MPQSANQTLPDAFNIIPDITWHRMRIRYVCVSKETGCSAVLLPPSGYTLYTANISCAFVVHFMSTKWQNCIKGLNWFSGERSFMKTSRSLKMLLMTLKDSQESSIRGNARLASLTSVRHLLTAYFYMRHIIIVTSQPWRWQLITDTLSTVSTI